jgi:hypothetical protein
VDPEDMIASLGTEAPIAKKIYIGDYLVRGPLVYVKV